MNYYRIERAMSDARDRRNDYGGDPNKRKFTRWCKRQLARATRRMVCADTRERAFELA